MNIDELMRLKKQIQRLQRERDKSRAALELARKELKTQFKCRTTKEAQKLCSKLSETVDTMRKELEERLQNYEDVLNAHLEKLEEKT